MTCAGKLSLSSLPERRSPTLTIFDWDDTLLCTSHLLRVEGDLLPDEATCCLRRLEDVAYQILRHAMRVGQVHIVTNASKGWVEASAAKHLPRLVPLLARVSIVSASSCFRGHFPGEVDQWKKLAFLKIARDVGIESFKSLIVIGDSDFEMNAADTIGERFQNVRIKAIKFHPEPTEQDLVRQLKLVLDSFDMFVADDRHLTVTLERTRAARRPIVSL